MGRVLRRMGRVRCHRFEVPANVQRILEHFSTDPTKGTEPSSGEAVAAVEHQAGCPLAGVPQGCPGPLSLMLGLPGCICHSVEVLLWDVGTARQEREAGAGG